jgi:hypothetical protein
MGRLSRRTLQCRAARKHRELQRVLDQQPPLGAGKQGTPVLPMPAMDSSGVGTTLREGSCSPVRQQQRSASHADSLLPYLLMLSVMMIVHAHARLPAPLAAPLPCCAVCSTLTSLA